MIRNNNAVVKLNSTTNQAESFTGQGIEARICQEFTGQSAIAPDVFAANVRIVPDLEFDPINREVLSTPIADELGFRYIRFGKKAKENETAALFLNEDGSVWQAKIFGPDSQAWLDAYQSQGKRTGQYMAPRGNGDTVYFANIPDRIARKIAVRVNPLIESSWLEAKSKGQSFWEWFQETPQVPVIVTEGFKKAAALISQGYAAIALYGCQCGVSDLAIKPELLPFVTGRQVAIAFDQDDKPETRQKVFSATRKLGRALVHHAKARVSIISWHQALGKGIDDVLANHPQKAITAIENARNFSQWKLDHYTDIPDDYIAQRLMTRYLGDLEIAYYARLIGIKSPKGTGKTESIAKIVAKAPSGTRVIILTHREQLGQDLARRYSLPYRTELGNCQEGTELGYVLCVDSLHGNATPPFKPDDWHGAWVIIDEAEQVFWHVLNSSTCQGNRAAILQTLTALLNNSDRVFLADADLSRIALDYARNLLEEPVQPYVILNEYRPDTARPLFLYESQSALFSKVKTFIENGDRVIIHCGAQEIKSKWGTQNLESLLSQRFPEKSILIIDAESVSTPNHPAQGVMGRLNEVLPQYDIVITSPTLETGVSIDIKHFDKVIAFGSGVQTVGAFCQTLARVRDDIPRHVYIPEYASQRIGNGSDDPYSIVKSQQKVFKFNQKILSELDTINALDDATPQHLKTWAAMSAFNNYGFKRYQEEVLKRLENEGYLLTIAATPEDVELVKAEVTAKAEINYQAQCQAISEAPLLDPDQYQTVKNKRAKSKSERLSEKKTAIARRYCTEDITPSLIINDDDGLYPKLLIHYYLTVGNPYVHQRDVKKAKDLSPDGNVFSPDFTRQMITPKIAVLLSLGMTQFLDPKTVFTNASLKEWADMVIKYRHELRALLGTSFDPERHTPIQIAQRLLKLLGLRLECTARHRVDGEIVRFYQMVGLNDHDRDNIFKRWLERDQGICDTTFSNYKNQPESQAA
jgi:hypothetical protein